jgi:hypothetical protein
MYFTVSLISASLFFAAIEINVSAVTVFSAVKRCGIYAALLSG